jgi:phosphate starvation-inducible membrane PsiE
VRLLGGIILAVLALVLYYMLVEYVPHAMKSAAAAAVQYNEYIAAPNTSQFFPYFLVILVALVVGYVAYRDRY